MNTKQWDKYIERGIVMKEVMEEREGIKSPLFLILSTKENIT